MKDGLSRTTNLVDVHVGLSSRSGLEDDERELIDELTADDLWEGRRWRNGRRKAEEGRKEKVSELVLLSLSLHLLPKDF